MDAPPLTPTTADGRLGTAAEHPGLRDPRYLARRRWFAGLAGGHQVGDPSPRITYLPSEHAVWRTVKRILESAHRSHACRAVLEAREAVRFPADRLPQHAEVGAQLRRLTGFDFTLAGGVVANERFLGSMAGGYFHAVQFVRHPAVPMYTPEPDLIHDVFGHGIHLAVPRFAEIYRLIGAAAARLRTGHALQIVSDLYWFTLEYGVVEDDGATKAYGAALLSSYGELGRFRSARIRELDVPAMLATPYDIAGYQPVLFRARCLNHVTDTLAAFLATLDDDTALRVRPPADDQPA
ncbi:phenylalanine 4-monooxygenase [Nonomuraea sp. NPDC050783]|uniref:phenylalanine 4-monooxygenase n=1 Tax=Nonomuraea sp. NPDC050783 TaxID=3154634 RepID=UPI003466DB50